MYLTRGEVHPGSVWVWRDADTRWSQPTCSFCGSISPLSVAEFLEAGNDASGSEWRDGWPHKFYVTDDDGKEWKFYAEHLVDLSLEEFARVTSAVARVLKVTFEYDIVGRMKIRAPSYGYQVWRKDGVEHILSGSTEPRDWELRLVEELQGA